MKTACCRIVLACALAVLTGDAAAQPVRTVDGKSVDPFRSEPDVIATVLVFASVDCPISNRYAPEVNRVFEEFAARGVRVYLVYPNPAESAAAIAGHLDRFAYRVAAVRDPDHALVARVGATVAPEAAVLDRHGALVYRGRLDDRYVAIGVERPAATRRDLREALAAVVSGRPVEMPRTTAVGCFLADFKQ